jgi:hypothetical protein
MDLHCQQSDLLHLNHLSVMVIPVYIMESTLPALAVVTCRPESRGRRHPSAFNWFLFCNNVSSPGQDQMAKLNFKHLLSQELIRPGLKMIYSLVHYLDRV